MNHYELICIYKPDLAKVAIDKLTNSIINNINDLNGKVIAQEIWGLRDLADNIKSHKKGYYFFVQIDIENKKLDNIKKSFNLDENIIRHQLIKVNEHEKLPTPIMEKNNEKTEKNLK